MATSILGVARFCRHRYRRRKDVTFMRSLVAQGLPPVLEIEDSGIVGHLMRAERFNPMAKKLRYALENWTLYLTHEQREDVLDALDWFQDNALAHHLPKEKAIEHCRKLESITWLKFRVDDSLRTSSN